MTDFPFRLILLLFLIFFVGYLEISVCDQCVIRLGDLVSLEIPPVLTIHTIYL